MNPAVGLTEDGKYFVYSSATEESEYVHYRERNGKEIWKYEFPGVSLLSPNGRYIFMSPADVEGPSILLDASAKILWERDLGDIEDAEFTSDNNNIVYSEFTEHNVYLLNIIEKTQKKIGTGSITSLSSNGTYIGIEIGNYLIRYEMNWKRLLLLKKGYITRKAFWH